MEIVTSTWREWTIVSIRGELVIKHLLTLRKSLEPLEQRQSPRLALDLGEIRYVDSSGISLLLDVKRRFDERGGRVVLFGASGELREIFSIVDLQQAIHVYPDRGSFEAAVSG
jgi:anti-sigma B factor antagonist